MTQPCCSVLLCHYFKRFCFPTTTVCYFSLINCPCSTQKRFLKLVLHMLIIKRQLMLHFQMCDVNFKYTSYHKIKQNQRHQILPGVRPTLVLVLTFSATYLTHILNMHAYMHGYILLGVSE